MAFEEVSMAPVDQKAFDGRVSHCGFTNLRCLQCVDTEKRSETMVFLLCAHKQWFGTNSNSHHTSSPAFAKSRWRGWARGAGGHVDQVTVLQQRIPGSHLPQPRVPAQDSSLI